MEKLPMCRICLVEDVRMCIVVNRNIHELYEKLTDIPFVTQDIRPILACFFCCAKLKQCYRLLRQCLKAEELFAVMTKDYEPNSLKNQDHLQFSSGFIITPIEYISIVDECRTESIAIKEELLAVSEILDDIIEPMEEHQSEELKLEILNNSCLDVADIPPQHSESDLEDYVPLIKIKTEVEEELDISKKKRRARDTKRATVAKKPKLQDAVTAEQTKKELDSKVIRTTRKRSPKPGTSFKEPYNQTRTQIGEKPKCDVCQRSFSTKRNLTYHIMRVHTGQKTYKCDVCQRSFSKKGHLSRHIRIHTGEKPYKCDVCQCSFGCTGSLLYHIRIHTGEKPYKCDVCQCSFIKKHHLSQHIPIHTSEKPYKCDVCQRSFSRKLNLIHHIRIHTGETPYKCDECQFRFNQKHRLSQHMHIHTGEKPYKCDVCQRSFNYKSNLTRHIRIHTGQKTYKCDVCQRSFSQKGHLSQHIPIHTGEKPYKCDVCQRSFNYKSDLTRHSYTHW